MAIPPSGRSFSPRLRSHCSGKPFILAISATEDGSACPGFGFGGPGATRTPFIEGEPPLLFPWEPDKLTNVESFLTKSNPLLDRKHPAPPGASRFYTSRNQVASLPPSRRRNKYCIKSDLR